MPLLSDLFIFDWETQRFGPGNMAPDPICMGFVDEDTNSSLHVDQAGPLLLRKLVEGAHLCNANIAYDLAVTAARWPESIPWIFQAYENGRVSDVLIRQKLIDIALGEYRFKEVAEGVFKRQSYSLAGVFETCTGEPMKKIETWRLRYGELVDVPWEQWPIEAKQYPAEDALAVWYAWKIQEEATLELPDIFHDEPARCYADFSLHLASSWGLITDEKGVRELQIQCEKRVAELSLGLKAAGLLDAKGARKMRIAQQRMADVGGTRLTKTGAELAARGQYNGEIKYLSVDAEACEDSGDPVLQDFAELTTVSALLNGHVKAMTEGIYAPIHTRFEVLMETGRTSSSSPNVQNVRRAPGARECFKPRDGFCYVGCDFDKAELHTLAQVCVELFQRSDLAEALNGGYDPHLGLGAKLAHLTYEEADARKSEDEIKEWRQRAKPANFGFPGGMSAKGMQSYAKSNYGLVLTFEECQQLYNGWREQWPVVAHDYLDWVARQIGPDGYGTAQHFGSKRYRGRVNFCALANGYFQGMAADGALRALTQVTHRCYVKHPGSALYGCRPVNFVHDEIIMECPLDGRLTEAALELRDVMVAGMNEYTRDVPVRASPVAMDRWSKKAVPLWENGELKVWHYAS